MKRPIGSGSYFYFSDYSFLTDADELDEDDMEDDVDPSSYDEDDEEEDDIDDDADYEYRDDSEDDE